MKKIISVLLALVMTLALSVSALAAGETGTITIDNAVTGQTYTIYQILYLESYNADSNAYAYKATEAWKSFVEGTDVKDIYMHTDEQGYVTWKEGADVAAFAKLAQAYAADAKNKVTATKTQEATSPTVTFTGLNLGYYLLDSSLGTLCSLDTTNPTVTIKEKNAEPTNVKTVQEDSTGNYGDKNDADIGQTVNFQSTITAQAGAENYVFHDKMSAGLTFGSVTGVTLNGNAVNASNYTVKTTGMTDGCTFEVVFTQTFCDTLKANDKIVISYTATVNDKAVIGSAGNPNESKISYGEKGQFSTVPSETKTYTWNLNVLKYGDGNEAKVLANAEFVLLNSAKNKVATVVNGKITGWVAVPAADENGTITWPANTVLTTGEDGTIAIAGLDSDTYYLREVKAPAGYNILASDVEVVITATKSADGTTLTYTPVTAKINNQSGTELPSTGGMGTTIFYVLGGVLMAGAFVLLVVRKRMRTE